MIEEEAVGFIFLFFQFGQVFLIEIAEHSIHVVAVVLGSVSSDLLSFCSLIAQERVISIEALH